VTEKGTSATTGQARHFALLCASSEIKVSNYSMLNEVSIFNIIKVETFYYQLMHIMLKNTELLKHSKITLQHVSVYI